MEILPENCCGLYVRAGSIIPIKLHDGALSLLRAQDKPIRLDIYLEQAMQTAEGYLYLDDGITFKYLD